MIIGVISPLSGVILSITYLWPYLLSPMSLQVEGDTVKQSEIVVSACERLV